MKKEELLIKSNGQWELLEKANDEKKPTGQANPQMGYSVFNMDHVNEISTMKDHGAAKQRAHEILAGSTANDKNREQIKRMINSSRNSRHLATGMSNHILAHPAEGLKVVKADEKLSDVEIKGLKAEHAAHLERDKERLKEKKVKNIAPLVEIKPLKKEEILKTAPNGQWSLEKANKKAIWEQTVAFLAGKNEPGYKGLDHHIKATKAAVAGKPAEAADKPAAPSRPGKFENESITTNGAVEYKNVSFDDKKTGEKRYSKVPHQTKHTHVWRDGKWNYHGKK